MQMQLASNPALSQPPLAAMPQLSEKPHLGFATKKTTWKPAPNVCNFTVTLGLQVVVVENGVRKTYSARYYNPATGRFLSEDPVNGQPDSPASLHKYVYANGDPMNLDDPTGNAAAPIPFPSPQPKPSAAGLEYAMIVGLIDIAAQPALKKLGCQLNIDYKVIALKVAFDFDITTDPDACNAKGKGRMRVQLQKGLTTTSPATQVMVNNDPPGVTTTQVYAALNSLWNAAQSGAAGFPFNSNQKDLRAAIISVSQCAGKFAPSGYGIPTRSLCSADVGKSGWRVDLDNLNGTNLRQ
jgi:RHS repeat-associated protein